MKRTLKDYAIIGLKGLAMGSADIVPGVSGGTIAFITGIYVELLSSIKSINLDALKALKNDGIKGFWTHINGTFLVSLFTGIGIAVVSMAKVLEILLDKYPEMLWGFFFGLILASAVVVARSIPKWTASSLIALFVGAVIAYVVTKITPTNTPDALWFTFVAGVIAICAMILPGISGSFLLLIMGKYSEIIEAINNLDFKKLIVFALGCVIGLLGFSRVLTWLFKKWRDQTIAVLTGFMLGSLNKVWPWKETTTFVQKPHRAKSGEIPEPDWIPAVQENVFPGSSYVSTPYEIEHGVLEKHPHTLIVVLLMVVGFVLVVGMSFYSASRQAAKTEEAPAEES